MQLNACSGRKAQDVEQELSHALAAESAYWGGGKVANLQAKWVDFAESECTNEAAVNVGGTAYSEMFADCVTSLTADRVSEVRATVVALRREQQPSQPVGQFPVDLKPSQ